MLGKITSTFFVQNLLADFQFQLSLGSIQRRHRELYFQVAKRALSWKLEFTLSWRREIIARVAREQFGDFPDQEFHGVLDFRSGHGIIDPAAPPFVLVRNRFHELPEKQIAEVRCFLTWLHARSRAAPWC